MQNVNKLEHERKAVRQTMWAVRCFQNWCFEHRGQTIDFNTVSKTDLNEILGKFYMTVKNGKGESYGFSGFMGLRAGLNRHLSEPPLSWCLVKDSEFMSSNDVFLGIAKKLQRESDQSADNQDKSDGDFMDVKRSHPSTPDGLTDMDGHPMPLVSLQSDPMDSDSSGGHSAVGQVPLRHVMESWGTAEAGVAFKTEDVDGHQEPSPVEIFTPAAASRLITDDEHVPYLTESQMMDRIRQQRFTQEELDILVREIQARYHRIYGKGLPFAAIRQAWEEVAAAVNSAGLGPTRTASSCQRRFRDLKRRARKTVTNGVSSRVSNGVGSRPHPRAESGPGEEDTQLGSRTGGAVDAGVGGASLNPSPPPSGMDVPRQALSNAGHAPSQAPLGSTEAPGPPQGPLGSWLRSLDTMQREFRPQSRNHFTKEQMDILLRQIKARYHRLFGDRQHRPRFYERRQAWEEVAAAVNQARCGPTKTAAACCKRFSDLKRRRKMRLGKHVVSVCQDGPFITAAFSHASPVGMKILPSVSMEPAQRPEHTPTAAAQPEPSTTLTPHTHTPTPAPIHTPTPATATAPAATLAHIPAVDPIQTLTLPTALTLPLTALLRAAAPSATPPPSQAPTLAPPPSQAPTLAPPPSQAPTLAPPPSQAPTLAPPPPQAPTLAPTLAPLLASTLAPPPSQAPTVAPTLAPLLASTLAPPPSQAPTLAPLLASTLAPPPSQAPMLAPAPSQAPTLARTLAPPPSQAPKLAPPPATTALTLTPAPTAATPSDRPAVTLTPSPTLTTTAPPAAWERPAAAVDPWRRQWEQELLEAQRGGLELLHRELGALRRGLDMRLRRMESRSYPLLRSISRSLERIASATEHSSAPGAAPPLDTDTPPRTPRARAAAEQPADQSRASPKGRAVRTCRRRRGRHT